MIRPLVFALVLALSATGAWAAGLFSMRHADSLRTTATPEMGRCTEGFCVPRYVRFRG